MYFIYHITIMLLIFFSFTTNDNVKKCS